MTVANNGTAPTNGWKVGWSWGGSEQIVNVWNGVMTSNGQPGVVIVNEPYNGSIAPGATTSFGFQATSSGTDGAPTLTCTAS